MPAAYPLWAEPRRVVGQRCGSGARLVDATELDQRTGPHVKAGKLKALAVTGPTRYATMPDVPTFEELGYKGANAIAWQGILAPARTPPAVVRRLNQELLKALASPELRELYLSHGAEIGGDSPEEFAAFIRAEHENWGRLIRETGVKLE